MIRPVLTYGCEAWTIRKKDQDRLHVFENKVLRKITGPVSTPDGWRRRTNEELRTVTRQTNILDFINTLRLRWAGHVARMESSELPLLAMADPGRGRRPLGRPRQRWGDNIRRTTRLREPWREVAQDRDRWRRIITDCVEARNRRPTRAPRS